VFARHHYLSHSFHRNAKIFVGYVNGKLAGMTSILHFPHPREKRFKQLHRTVVFPDFQGLGIGHRLRNFVANLYKKKGFRVITTLSHPVLIHAMQNDSHWRCTSQKRHNKPGKRSKSRMIRSRNRITTSWEYQKNS